MHPTKLRSFGLSLRTESYDYRTPMKFGGRVVSDVTVASVDCRAETGQAEASGFGSMTMGVAWAWPSRVVEDATKLVVVLDLIERLIDLFHGLDQTGHPLDICHRAIGPRGDVVRDVAAKHELAEPIPELAVLLALSPIEAALFDAHGKAAGKSTYQLLSAPDLDGDLQRFLGPSYSGVMLDELIATKPAPSMPLYHLVGALDPLTTDDLNPPVGDGLPETLGDWIHRDGLTHLKIKLAGDDLGWDTDRVARVDAVARQSRPGQTHWSYSLDFNERCDDEDYVLRLLENLATDHASALDAIGYIEQPTHRDLLREPIVTMHQVADRLPVVIDESLIDLNSLRTAIDQGYSGIALKACKGHSEAILLGAAARHEGLYLCVQDLTCVGASLLHSASLAAHIPGVAAVESNGRQYCPQGNERWLERFEPFFEVRGGSIPTGMLDGPGLGYGEDPAATQ